MGAIFLSPINPAPVLNNSYIPSFLCLFYHKTNCNFLFAFTVREYTA